MLIKSFVTVTTSYRNKTWKSKLRRQGNEGIVNFGTRAVVRYKANKGPKGVEQGCLQMSLHSAIKVFLKLFWGAPPSPSACPRTKWPLIGAVTFSFYSFSFLLFSFFSFFPFILSPLSLAFLFSFCQHKIYSGTNGPTVRYIFHPWLFVTICNYV